MTLRRRPRSAALLRLGYRVAYRALQVWTFALRPRVDGTMIVVSDERGRILLIRHTYGDRRTWELPGGWVQAGEAPLVGAARELAEEVGLHDAGLRPLGALDGDWQLRHEHLTYFAADFPPGTRARYDPVEIAEVAWFDPRLPPARLGRGTAAVLGQLAGSYAETSA